ncbi:MAG TPA: Hsp20/alpha crystallin family protein [Vicinamibacterales bacterium]|nr:Hsp20/alpha crystallin family protein [Vicinamibacterales bacterium]
MAQKSETESKSAAESQKRQGDLERAPERTRSLSRRDPFEAFSIGPFAMMRRMQEDIDRLFDSIGFGRFGAAPASLEFPEWTPAIDAFHRGNEFVVRADIPGLSREDLSVEIGDDSLTIRGERKYDREEERGGVFRSERGYGTFCRVVALPEGVLADSAKANFKNGVLEVVMQAPPQEVRRGRQIEIGEEDRPEQGGRNAQQK